MIKLKKESYLKIIGIFISLSIIFSTISIIKASATELNLIDQTESKSDLFIETYQAVMDNQQNIALGNKKEVFAPDDTFIAILRMTDYEKIFGFSGLEYSLGYDPSQLTLMTSLSTEDNAIPSEGSTQTDFQNNLWNNINSGKLKPANSEYGEFRLSNYDPTGYLDSAVEGQRQIEAYIYSTSSRLGKDYNDEKIFKGSEDDNIIGVFMFKVNKCYNKNPDMPALNIFYDESSLILSHYTQPNFNYIDYIISGGYGENDLYTYFNPIDYQMGNIYYYDVELVKYADKILSIDYVAPNLGDTYERFWDFEFTRDNLKRILALECPPKREIEYWQKSLMYYIKEIGQTYIPKTDPIDFSR
ncbi:MAG: hypothetical protein KFW09_03245 [Oscillospiraceae bacterium]|nr:hypothetical protein [Oscillospiraceae bacterium]